MTNLYADDVYGMCGLMCASKEQFSPGSFEIVVEDVSYSPPFCIENRTNTYVAQHFLSLSCISKSEAESMFLLVAMLTLILSILQTVQV